MTDAEREEPLTCPICARVMEPVPDFDGEYRCPTIHTREQIRAYMDRCYRARGMGPTRFRLPRID